MESYENELKEDKIPKKIYKKYKKIEGFKNNDIREEKIYKLNVKYYITKGSFNKRINKKPFYSYIQNEPFTKEDVINLLKREKLRFNEKELKIKIENENEKCFEKMNDDQYYWIGKSGFITLKIKVDEAKENINEINNLKDQVKCLKKKFDKYEKRNIKYDLIYLYASPIFDEKDKKTAIYKKISYREEMNIIINLMTNKGKEFKCLFECASENVLINYLKYKKAKILHISSHGAVNESQKDKYTLKLENSKDCGTMQSIEEGTLITNLNDKINKFDLIVLLSCYSERFKNIIVNNNKTLYPKYIIYVKILKNDDTSKNKLNGTINDTICIQFTKYFYSELINGNSIEESFKKAKENLKVNGDILKISNTEEEEKKLFQEIDKLQLYNRFNNDETKSEGIKENNLSGINDKNLILKKIKSRFNSDDKPFAENDKGELRILNKNVKKNFHAKKYRYIIGRVHIIKQVLDDLNNNSRSCKFTVIYGDKSNEKYYFVESLCVFLFERKQIDDYRNFDKFSEEIEKYIKSIKISFNKIIISIKINGDEIKTILEDFKDYQNFYFILIVDQENIDEIEEDIEKKKINCNFFDVFLNRNGAINLFKNLCPNEKLYETTALKIINIYDKYLEKQNGQNCVKKYDPKIIEQLCDSYIANKFELKNVSLDEKSLIKPIEITLDNTKYSYSYLFLLSKMPLGLPDRFIYIVFKRKENFANEFTSRNTNNNWNYLNQDIKFEEGFKEDSEKYKKFKEKSIKYLLKALKLYCRILYFYIQKDRDEIIYPDEKIHFIFNSYNNEGIWKSNIAKKYENKIYEYEMEFLSDDFNIKNHVENIYKLINYLVNKIKYFEDKPKYIEYLLDILLLFPSYFFLKKICYSRVTECKGFCDICIAHFESNLKLLEERKNKEIKINIQNIISPNPSDDKDLMEQKKRINELRMELEEQKQICQNNFDIWKELYIIKSEETKKKFINQKAKLSLFLYSISSKEIKDLPKDLPKELELEYKIIKAIKSNDVQELEEILKDNTISQNRKALLYYELSTKYYKKDKIKTKEYLMIALDNAGENKFLKHRIKIDLNYIFLNENINIDEKCKNFFYSEFKEKINILDNLNLDNSMINYQKLNEEKNNLRKKFFEKLEKLELKPNVIMLNANPLNNGYSLLSSGIHSNLNNQYYILEKLYEKRDKVKSEIKIKSYVLNKKNLKTSLKNSGEILIIQSDDFTEDGDIVLESDEGISQKLNKEKFIDMFDEKIIKYKIIILCFFNSDKFAEFLTKKKVKYECLICFKPVGDINKIKFDRKYFDFIIDLISNYNKNGEFLDSIMKKFEKNNKFCKCIKKGDLNINNNSSNDINKGIFFLDSLLDKQITDFQKINIYENYYANEILEIIGEIQKGNAEIICNKKNKEKYIEMGIEIIKYFYRHKTYLQYYIMNFGSNTNKTTTYSKSIEVKNKNKSFYLIYNCDDIINLNEFLEHLKNNNDNFMVIYDDKKNYSDDDMLSNEYYSNEYYSNEDSIVDFYEYSIFKEEKEIYFDI